MNIEETVLTVIFLIGLIALPFGISILLNGWMFGPKQWLYSYITIIACVAMLVLLILVVKR